MDRSTKQSQYELRVPLISLMSSELHYGRQRIDGRTNERDMRMPPRVFVYCLAAMVLALPAHGQEFRGLGFLDPDADKPYSVAYGISGAGTTVVGGSNFQAFRWTTATPGSLEPLGFLPGGVSSAARGASADGSVVVG